MMEPTKQNYKKNPERKLPKVPKNLDDAERKKMEEKHRGRSASLYTLANRELEYITKTCKQLDVYDELVIKKLQEAVNKLEAIRRAITSDIDDSGSNPAHDDETGDDMEKELRQFKKYIRKMKLPIPSRFDAKDLEKQLQELNKSATKTAEQLNALMFQKQVPRLHKNQTFENSPAFKDFEVQYNALSPNLKLCLLCFSVFPARAIIKKRLMVYWWIAEGFIGQQKSDSENKKDLEQLGAGYFDELIKKDFIRPYHNKRRLEVETCKMPPFIRSAVISIAARAKFFDFNSTGRPEANCPNSFRSALFEEDLNGIESDFDFEKFHVLFNVSEKVLDIRPEWIHRMTTAVVLYLGRWQSMGNHHIEVDEEKFLEALGDMKHLKLLSLQGISRIVELPNQVTKLGNLTILDLRACHNLEKIPHDIGLLKSLTHLDLSECYLLERIPKGLSKLKNLLVLKGFAVVEPSKHSCSLKDLSKLPKLRKLSIFTGLKDFPSDMHLIEFQQLKALTKLKVVWGGGAKKEDNDKTLLPANETELSVPPTTDSDVVQEPEGIRKEPQDKTTPSSKGSAPQDMAKMQKLRNLKQNFCFGETTPLETDTKMAANGAMDSEAPVLGPQLASEAAAEPGQVTGPTTGPELTSTLESADSCLSKTKSISPEGSSKLPGTLEKLELQCYPKNKAPGWLNPTKLQKLKKLYIRGGQLCDLGGNSDGWNESVNPWQGVEVLRLKYLTGLAMHWKQVETLFPQLVYLEKVNCPQLTFFPCDEAGVWINKQKLPNQ